MKQIFLSFITTLLFYYSYADTIYIQKDSQLIRIIEETIMKLPVIDLSPSQLAKVTSGSADTIIVKSSYNINNRWVGFLLQKKKTLYTTYQLPSFDVIHEEPTLQLDIGSVLSSIFFIGIPIFIAFASYKNRKRSLVRGVRNPILFPGFSTLLLIIIGFLGSAPLFIGRIDHVTPIDWKGPTITWVLIVIVFIITIKQSSIEKKVLQI
jgi:hypothetical protein